MNTVENTRVNKLLLDLQGQYSLSSIEHKVIEDALEYGDDPIRYLEDVTMHGCVSGMVNGLIYYCDTYAFFDKYYHEIEEIRANYAVGTPLELIGDLKNYLAWSAYEQVAQNILLTVLDDR